MNKAVGLVACLLASGVGAQEQDFITNMETLPTPAVTPYAAAPAQHDVLVFYTTAAASGISSKVQTYVNNTNSYYGLSSVNVHMNLLATLPSPVQESGSGMPDTLTAFRQNAEVRSLRAQYGADMVVLISTDSGGWCGYAYLWFQTINGVTNTDAYAVVRSSCNSITFAHECGHLGGLSHNIENDNGPPMYVYGRGYRVCAADGFRTIMSYACPSVSTPQLTTFSSPSIMYGPYPTGVPDSKDAARALNDSAVRVSTYMKAVVTPPTTAPQPPVNIVIGE